MSLRDVSQVADLPAKQAITELQGLRVSRVDGAANGTKMDIAALRVEDTLVSVLAYPDTWAANSPTDDTANVTIQATKASGTITITGNPVAEETVTVNDNVYTWKATPTALGHVKITAGNNNQMATDLAAAINAVETRRLPTGNPNNPQVTATSSTNVVTVTSVADGAGNGVAIASSDGTDLAVTGNGTASATVTASAVDDADTVTVNTVVFTAAASPSGDQQFKTWNSDNTAQALAIANAINRYEEKYGTLDVVATAAAAVVTIVPKSAKKGNIIPLTEASTNVAVSGATLANGTATGGIKSTTNHATNVLVVYWFDKNP